MNIKEFSNEIIGQLDYNLRHSNCFGCISGEDISELKTTFTSRNGSKCNIVIKIELEDVELVEKEKIYNPSQKTVDRFLTMLNRHLNGDDTVLPADDPRLPSKFGFVYTNKETGKDEFVTLRSEWFRKNFPDKFNELMITRDFGKIE